MLFSDHYVTKALASQHQNSALPVAIGLDALTLMIVAGSLTRTTASALADQILLAAPAYLLDSSKERSNFCTGGLENGKIIVSESYLRNGFKETTVLGCQVDGGQAVQMPDLPSPDARATRLA